MNQSNTFKNKTEKLVKRNFNFVSKEFKKSSREGVTIAKFSGLLTTHDVDFGGDKIEKGALTESLNIYRKLNKAIPLKLEHKHLLGGIFKFEETDEGLMIEADINLETRQGAETYSFLKMGALTGLSLGYYVEKSVMQKGVRLLQKIFISEGSIVDEPMNFGAVILNVKKNGAENKIEHDNNQRPKNLIRKITRNDLKTKGVNKLLTKRALRFINESLEDKNSELEIQNLIKKLKV